MLIRSPRRCRDGDTEPHDFAPIVPHHFDAEAELPVPDCGCAYDSRVAAKSGPLAVFSTLR